MGSAGTKNDGQKGGEKTQKFMAELGKVRKKACGSCGYKCWIAVGILISIVVIFLGVCELAAAGYGTKYTIFYTSELTGRLLSYVVLAASAAVALVVTVYSVVQLFKKDKNPLVVAGIILFTAAVVQAIICGVSIQVTSEDRDIITENLRESFKLAAAGHARHLKYWALTSSEHKCCGVDGPEDYKTSPALPVPPNVPIFCCPGYNSSESDASQEHIREICKSVRAYYQVGCSYRVYNAAGLHSGINLIVTILLISFEVLFALHLYITNKVSKKRRQKDEEAVKNLEAGASNAAHK